MDFNNKYKKEYCRIKNNKCTISIEIKWLTNNH